MQKEKVVLFISETMFSWFQLVGILIIGSTQTFMCWSGKEIVNLRVCMKGKKPLHSLQKRKIDKPVQVTNTWIIHELFKTNTYSQNHNHVILCPDLIQQDQFSLSFRTINTYSLANRRKLLLVGV